MIKIISYMDAVADGEKAKKLLAALNYSIPIFMGIYLFSNPFPLSALSEFCYYLSLSALIILLIFRKTDFTLRWPLTIPIVLFFIWAVFGLLFTLDFRNTLHDLRGHLLEYLVVFYLLVNYFNSKKKLETISWIIISSVTIFSIGAIIQFYFIEGFPFTARLGKTFKEMYTSWMCLITVFALTLTLHNLNRAKSIAGKVMLAGCFLIITVTTLLNQSRGALIGLLVALTIMCFNNKKTLIFIIIAIIFTISMPGTRERLSDKGLSDIRSQMNRLSIEIVKEYPITGVGFGMQIYGNKNVLDLERFNKKLSPEYQQKTGIVQHMHIKSNGLLPPEYKQKTLRIISSPHNTILDIAVRTGIVGLGLFLSMLLTAVWMLWQTLRRTKSEYFRSWAICLFACLMSFMFQAFFVDTTYNSRAIAFYTILAMITILWNLAKNEKTQEISPSA